MAHYDTDEPHDGGKSRGLGDGGTRRDGAHRRDGRRNLSRLYWFGDFDRHLWRRLRFWIGLHFTTAPLCLGTRLCDRTLDVFGTSNGAENRRLDWIGRTLDKGRLLLITLTRSGAGLTRGLPTCRPRSRLRIACRRASGWSTNQFPTI